MYFWLPLLCLYVTGAYSYVAIAIGGFVEIPAPWDRVLLLMIFAPPALFGAGLFVAYGLKACDVTRDRITSKILARPACQAAFGRWARVSAALLLQAGLPVENVVLIRTGFAVRILIRNSIHPIRPLPAETEAALQHEFKLQLGAAIGRWRTFLLGMRGVHVLLPSLNRHETIKALGKALGPVTLHRDA